MKLAVMQPYFFPYIGYFQLIESVDKFIIYQHVSFRKKSWITRNRLFDKSAGLPFLFNIPVRHQSSNTLIRDVQISGSRKEWTRKFLKILQQNYAKAAHFKEIKLLLQTALTTVENNNLHEFNSKFIIAISQFLELDTIIQYQNEDFISLENELESTYTDGDTLLAINKKTQRIIEMCKYEKASHYINPFGGQQLYHKQLLKEYNLQLNFIETLDYKYDQFGFEFAPHLSILDVLMHLGRKGTQPLLKNYQLI